MADLIIGNFGYRTNQLDGQTIKTRVILEYLEKKVDRVDSYDISQMTKIGLIGLLFKISKYRNIYVLPGINFLKYFCPLILFFSNLSGSKVHYIVVGGWVTGLINNSYFSWLFSKFYSISLELPSMVSKMKAVNPRSFLLTNFRTEPGNNFPVVSEPRKSLRLIYYSRVMREKGVFKAISLAERLNKTDNSVLLDIYGPLHLDENDEKEFLSRLCKEIRYHGSLDPATDDIVRTLASADFFLFPSYYQGEGFPGCLVESLFANVPVIASKWKYNSEIILDGENGFVFDNYVESAFQLLDGYSIDSSTYLELIETTALHKELYTERAFYQWFDNVHSK